MSKKKPNEILEFVVYPGDPFYNELVEGYGRVGQDLEFLDDEIEFSVAQLKFVGKVTGRIHVEAAVAAGKIEKNETIQEGMARHLKTPSYFKLTTKFSYP